jgi:hypothetical protein
MHHRLRRRIDMIFRQIWPRRPLHLCGMKPTDPDLSCTSLPGMIRVNITWTSTGRIADSSRRHHLKQPQLLCWG